MFNMKKSLSLLRLLTAAILLSASGGCSETNDPDPEGGGDPPVKEPVTYTITLGETSEQGAAVKVTPSDETATYYCGIHSEASLLGIPTATLLRQIASLDDLDERLHTGTEEFTIAETLTPVTSYKIVVAGYDGKEFTGDIALSEAFAVEPPAGPAAFTFEVKEKSFDNTVIDITPLAAEVPYFAEVKEAAVCDAMTDDAIISEILNLYGSMAEWFTYTGPTTITSSGDFGTLVPGTDYYVLAFGYADGAAATELTKHKFTTDPEGDPTANTFAFDISGVTARSASTRASATSGTSSPTPNIRNTAATPRASGAIWPTTSKARSTTSSPRRRRSFRSSACAATSGSTMSSSNPPRPTTCGRPASTPQAMPRPHRQ